MFYYYYFFYFFCVAIIIQLAWPVVGMRRLILMQVHPAYFNVVQRSTLCLVHVAQRFDPWRSVFCAMSASQGVVPQKYDLAAHVEIDRAVYSAVHPLQ